MKLKMLGMLTGAALLGITSTNASAYSDVRVGVQIGVPAPVYVEYVRVYDYDRARYVRVPRHDVRHCRHHRHDRGWHRGHAKYSRRHYRHYR